MTSNNNSALWSASQRAYTDIVKLLLEAGADATTHNNDPIAFASRLGNIDMVKMLIDADITAGDNVAIKYILENRHMDIVKLLRSVANPNTN